MFIPTSNINYFFIHIPRTSGTNLEVKLLKELYNINKIPSYHTFYYKKFELGVYKDRNNHWHSATHFTYNEMLSLMEELNIKIDHFFTMVRNPIDRAASLYKYWNFDSASSFLNYLHNINVNDCNYNGIQCETLDAKNNSKHRYYHFMSQYAYLYPFDNIEILKITQKYKIKNMFKISVIYLDGRQQKNRKANLQLFSKDVVNKIYQIYEKDFDTFKYTKEYTEKSAF